MKSFPIEFSELVNKRRYTQARSSARLLRGDKLRVIWFPLLMDHPLVNASIHLLNRNLGAFLKPWDVPICPSTITAMKVNFSELLPKTVRNQTVILNNSRSPAYAAARRIGLTRMLGSESLHKFAEEISGFSLDHDPGFQVIQYRTGDYIGPHNDHHPEDANLREGYVDLQITLTNEAVERQLFMYEDNGYLNQTVNVGIRSGVSISILPFWHQVSPLEAKPGMEQRAQRWVLLVSWEIIRRRL